MNDNIITFLIIVILLIIPISALVISSVYTTAADDEAMTYCNEFGHETFVTYRRYPFSSTPKAIVCGTLNERQIEEMTITGYSVDGDTLNLNNLN